MTQLIGLICENRKKVILISDRMVTTSNGSLCFEHERKCERVAYNALILTAGTTHEPELVEDTKAEIKGKVLIRNIAEILSKHYRKIRKKRIKHEILEEIGISSFDEFHKKQNILHSGVTHELSERIRKFDLNLSLLLGGVDEEAHLYRIGEPGAYRSFDGIGFCCIGIGNRHADPVFAFYGFSPKLLVEDALKIGFEAKKRAEMAGGVGKQTDVWIIDKKGIKEVKPETIKELEDSHVKQEDYSRLLKSVKIETTNFGVS